MAKRDFREQHIAVFGESGSGKTVLLSSFYGSAQEAEFEQEHRVLTYANDTGEGNRLYQNYLKMRNSAILPIQTRVNATSYTFTIEPKSENAVVSKSKSTSARLRLVWHDYPGEWWEQDPQGPEETQRRVDTFRRLLGSNVAFLLVDGQRLLDNAGEEERYLKHLLNGFRNTLLPLKDQLGNGQPLTEFPRIWILALSKADLLPDMSVLDFKNLLIEKVGAEIAGLGDFLKEFVQGTAAFSFGEDFLRLSSAHFETEKIEVSERVGVDLIVPIAAMLPVERHLKWAKAKELPAEVTKDLLGPAAKLASLLIGRALGRFGPFGAALTVLFSKKVMDSAADLAREALEKIHADALAKHNYLRATLAHFQLELNQGEEERVLMRSRR